MAGFSDIWAFHGVWTCLGRHDTTRVSVVRMYYLCILWANSLYYMNCEIHFMI